MLFSLVEIKWDSTLLWMEMKVNTTNTTKPSLDLLGTNCSNVDDRFEKQTNMDTRSHELWIFMVNMSIDVARGSDINAPDWREKQFTVIEVVQSLKKCFKKDKTIYALYLLRNIVGLGLDSLHRSRGRDLQSHTRVCPSWTQRLSRMEPTSGFPVNGLRMTFGRHISVSWHRNSIENWARVISGKTNPLFTDPLTLLSGSDPGGTTSEGVLGPGDTTKHQQDKRGWSYFMLKCVIAVKGRDGLLKYTK